MKRSKLIITDNLLIRDWKVTDDDREMVKIFFSNMGYDTSKSIHQQFMLKYAYKMYLK